MGCISCGQGSGSIRHSSPGAHNFSGSGSCWSSNSCGSGDIRFIIYRDFVASKYTLLTGMFCMALALLVC